MALSKNEYTYGQQTQPRGVLAMTKLKNQLKKINPELTIELKNIRINGITKGCSGFVTDPDTGRIIYVNTEDGTGRLGALYRAAQHNRDYTGGRNHFASPADLAEHVVDMLQG